MPKDSVEVEIANLWSALGNCKDEQSRQREAHDKMEQRSAKALEDISTTINRMGNDFKVIKWSVISLVVGVGLGIGALSWETLLKFLL